MANILEQNQLTAVRSRRTWRKLSGILESVVVSKGLRLALSAGLMLAAFIAVMALIQFATPDLPDNDGFYHIRLAAILRAEGLKPAFPWLPLSILNPREFYDHHFLFHVALIPFTFGDLHLGAKWAAVVFASLAFVCIWWLLRGQRVRYAALWSFGLLAVSEAFLYRMSIARAQSLSLGVLALGLHWMLTGRHRLLLPLAFVYVWMYDAFPLLLVVAGLYVLAVALVERRLAIQPLVYAGVGTVLGMSVNPYFPYNILFAYRHILPKIIDSTAVSVGVEWYPYKTSQLLENSPLALLAFLSGALALGLRGRKMQVAQATGFLTAIFFGLLLFQSRRFVEYFPAFALVFAALAWAPLLDGFNQLKGGRLQILRQHAPGLILAAALVPGLWITGRAAQASLRTSQPYTRYAAASAWLAGNTPTGARVFQTDWDDFPRLFYYNTHNTYLVGLDPTYLQLYDAELYDEWVDITKGREERPSGAIASRFGARYVLTDRLHQDFIRRANEDPGLREVYRDQQAVIYQVIDAN